MNKFMFISENMQPTNEISYNEGAVSILDKNTFDLIKCNLLWSNLMNFKDFGSLTFAISSAIIS